MTTVNDTAARAPLALGFDDPALDSQAVFRSILEAFSRPGRISSVALSAVPPAPLNIASAAVGLAMFDLSTPAMMSAGIATEEAADYLRFHTGCPIVTRRGQAAFAIIDGLEADSFEDFTVGTPEYPDRSATVIVQVDDLLPDGDIELSGPGIENRHRLGVKGLTPGFWPAWSRNGVLFPLGIDVILTAGERLACLPRTTRAEV